MTWGCVNDGNSSQIFEKKIMMWAHTVIIFMQFPCIFHLNVWSESEILP